MLYIGIDLGTSSVKLLLMDGAGRILNVVSREYPLSFPHPGWSELGQLALKRYQEEKHLAVKVNLNDL